MRIAVVSAAVSVVIAAVPVMGEAETVTWDGSGD